MFFFSNGLEFNSYMHSLASNIDKDPYEFKSHQTPVWKGKNPLLLKIANNVNTFNQLVVEFDNKVTIGFNFFNEIKVK